VVDLQRIHRVIDRTRRRLRLMAALDAATTAAVPAVAGALALLWLHRMQILSARGALGSLLGLAAAVVLAAIVAAARRLPARHVANRVDRASGLADRLGTAYDFSERLGDPQHPETRALMEAAIADGVAAAPRAKVEAAAPIRLPRDLRPLGAFVAVAAIVALLRFGPEPPRGLAAAAAAGAAAPPPAAPPETRDPDDVDYQKQFVEDMKALARDTGDPALEEMARELQALLDKAERGEIGKQELITQMEALEKKYSKASGDDVDAMLADLKEQGKELKKKAVTKKLGEAMEAGDLEQAQKELEKLAGEVEKGELPPAQKKQLAEALEQAAERQEQKQAREEKQREEQAQKAIDKKQEEIRRLQKKVEREPENEEARRTLQREKRELERLEREKQEQAERPKRRLERLTRDMKNAAENLKQKDQEQQAAKNMRDAAGESRRVQDELRRLGNQKKVKSQLSDLKEAIRRAKPKKGGGQRAQQARMQRIQEWQRRAGGQRGNAQAWRQGDQPGGKEGQLRQGKDPGTLHGDSPGGDPLGDPTDRFGKTKDEKLTGVHGQGPSRRETILTSAKKGFAHAGYRKVYADYKKAAEEVMTQEKVPQGYKYYVKRYFQRIKPHSMD
jgi:hypothetical protein